MRTLLLSVIIFLGLYSLPSFAQSSSSKVQTTVTRLEQLDPPGYKDFRLAIGGGYAYRLGKKEKYNNSKLDQLMKDLCHGYNIDIDAQYFFQENWGLGLNFNYVGASASGSDIDLPNVGSVSEYTEKNRFTYIGPAFVGRNDFGKFLLTYTIGFGPLFYKNIEEIPGAEVSGTKTTFGINAGVAMEYKLNESLGAGLKLSYTAGSIKSLDGSEGGSIEFEDRVNVSNFMVTGFLSFRTWK